MAQVSKRFYELDTLRGIAIILMIAYHTIWDLSYFSLITIPLKNIAWLQQLTASLFFVLVGIGVTISFSRRKSSKHLLDRGFKVFLLGMLISLFTVFTFPAYTVWFGVLHFIGVAIMISPLFIRWRVLNIAFACICFLLSYAIQNITTTSLTWVWLGIIPVQFTTFDNYPLLPWFGLVLLGIFVGKTLYYPKRQFHLQEPQGVAKHINAWLGFLGKHALLIYFLHLPILYGIIWLIA